MQNPDAIIVGAGPAGLACAAMMRAAGLRVCVLEKAGTVGPAWRQHYDRLHLHTDRRHSGLPGLAMPASYPKYPSRAHVVDYLERYAARFELQPRFGTDVTRIRREDGRWRIEAGEVFCAPVVVVATGIAGSPYRPSWTGDETFLGEIRHSSHYRNPQPYLQRRVLVVGFGNSGGEIALDLADAGVDVALAVRGPVQILPRELFGLPTITWAIFYKYMPARLVDWINAPILRFRLGRIEDLGLQLSAKGPRRMVEEDDRVPLFDIGTLDRIRAGAIGVRGAIARFTPEGVVFADGRAEPFDAVILATGFRPDLRRLLPDEPGLFDGRGMPLVTGRSTAAPGLYFCGQRTSPTGQLREIGIEARRIAALAAALPQMPPNSRA